MYTIHLYKLPDKDLNPNKRLHHQTLSKVKRQAKEEMMVRVYEQVQSKPKQPIRQCHIHTRFFIADKRRRDGDNLFCSMKAYFDGLVSAKLLEDDASDFVSHSFDIRRVQDAADTVITIEEGRREYDR